MRLRPYLKTSLSLIYALYARTRGIDRLHFLREINQFKSLDVKQNRENSSCRTFVCRFFLASRIFCREGVNILAKRDYKSPHGEELPSARNRNRVTMLFGCSLFDDANVTE